MRLVIFGPQGAGKGTQSARIGEKYAIPSISTGDIFRWAVAGKTVLGHKALDYVAAGKLVPDDLTIEVVRDRLEAPDCEPGFLLDGFPRNLDQARALDEILADKGQSLDAAMAIEVAEDVSLRRILGRRVCSTCGRNYNLDVPPEVDWTCDKCGGKVISRTDDHLESTVRQRLALYHEQTVPLKNYYRERGLLSEVDGYGQPDDVFQRLIEALEAPRTKRPGGMALAPSASTPEAPPTGSKG